MGFLSCVATGMTGVGCTVEFGIVTSAWLTKKVSTVDVRTIDVGAVMES